MANSTPEKKPVRRSHNQWPLLHSPLDRFFRGDLPDMWDEENMETIPLINITDEKDTYAVKMAVPGLRKEDLDIDVEGNLLTISCEKETEQGEDENYSRREYNYSYFSRTVTLPEDADTKGIKATYKDGILQLSVPKKEGPRKTSQKIQIQ